MRILAFFVLFAAIFTLGCERDMTKGIQEEIVETLTPLEKAQEAMARVNERRIEAHQRAEETGNFSVLFFAAGPIYQAELGFGEETWEKLLDTWEDAHNERVQGLFQAGKIEESMAKAQSYVDFLSFYFPKFDFENMSGGEFFFEYMSAYDEIVIEYLRITYEYPDSTQEKHLTLLKNSMVDGKVSIQYPEAYPEK